MTPEQEQLLADWYATENDAAAAQLAIANYAEQYQALFDRKRALATMVSQSFFPTKPEGTSVVQLAQGWQLKQVLHYKRVIDAEALESIRDPLMAHNVSLDLLVRRKPELETRLYRQLTAEARAVVDTILTTTPGAPTVEFVAPKEEKKPAAAEAQIIPITSPAKKGKGKGKGSK